MALEFASLNRARPVFFPIVRVAVVLVQADQLIPVGGATPVVANHARSKDRVAGEMAAGCRSRSRYSSSLMRLFSMYQADQCPPSGCPGVPCGHAAARNALRACAPTGA